MAAVRESCAVWKTLPLVRICTFAVSSTKVPGERIFGAPRSPEAPSLESPTAVNDQIWRRDRLQLQTHDETFFRPTAST
jgi:hypothetical protein